MNFKEARKQIVDAAIKATTQVEPGVENSFYYAYVSHIIRKTAKTLGVAVKTTLHPNGDAVHIEWLDQWKYSD